jgi:hypothetical protein
MVDDDIIKNAPISISVIDYIGKVENGVAMLLNLTAGEKTYEIGYWFNEEGQISLIPEDRLLKKLNIKDIYEYDKINEFIYFIHNSIENKEEILKQFLH